MTVAIPQAETSGFSRVSLKGNPSLFILTNKVRNSSPINSVIRVAAEAPRKLHRGIRRKLRRTFRIAPVEKK